MHDGVAALQDAVQCRLVNQRSLEGLGARCPQHRQRLRAACRRDDAMAVVQQAPQYMSADETRGAGEKNLHDGPLVVAEGAFRSVV
jgi:hypothetical protein